MAEDNSKSREQKIKELRARLDAVGRTFPQRKRGTAFSADEMRRAIRKQKQPEKELTVPEPIIYHRDLPRRESPTPEPGAGGGWKVTLEESVHGIEVRSGCGKAFMVSTRVDDLDEAKLSSSTFKEKVSAEDSSLCQRIFSVCGPQELTPHDIIFAERLVFQKDELAEVCRKHGITVRNIPDIIYTYRARRMLPARILATGHWAIEPAGRGAVAFLPSKPWQMGR